MSGHLSTGEAALLYCILCKVDNRYPTVEESIRYMTEPAKKEKPKKEDSVYSEQLSLF